MNEPNPEFHAAGQRPWTVIVRDGVVVGRYRAEDSYATDAEVNRVSLGDGPVDVYEVDARMPPPPKVGEQVLPEDLQRWTRTRPTPRDCTPQPPADD
jgi:hypothetical protein